MRTLVRIDRKIQQKTSWMQYFDFEARFVSLDPPGIVFGSPVYRTRTNSNVSGKLLELDIQSKNLARLGTKTVAKINQNNNMCKVSIT